MIHKFVRSDLSRAASRMMRLVVFALIGLAAAAGSATAQAPEAPPVTDAMLQDPAPGDWLMWRRTLNGWGYSPLDQIDRENVNGLRLVWTRALSAGYQEGTPLVYGGTLYMPNPNDHLQAIDAATGDLFWEYRRETPAGAAETLAAAAGLASVNRNVAIYGNVIIDTGNDGYVYAVDAATGELAWATEIFDYATGAARHSSGPIVANGKVVSGRSCRPAGGPAACVIVAHDANDRRRAVADPPGARAGRARRRDLGRRALRGAGARGVVDGAQLRPRAGPHLCRDVGHLPAPKFLLGGSGNKHLYHNSTLALDADTGEIRWYYQHLNDHWDMDHSFERLLVDTAVAPDPDAVSWINPRLRAGEVRKVVTGIPGKTGVVYTLDRETGEFLWATPTVGQNLISDIDGATGEVTENPEVIFSSYGQQILSCPGWLGGKDWEAGAYSPLTNTMYYPLRNSCARVLATPDEGLAIYQLAARFQLAPGTDQLGTVRAISAETGRTTWLREQRAATLSLVATGGGLVFGGDVQGRFRALDQETGEVLWEINLGSPVTGFPISFAVDGRQYVAVSTGTAASAAAFVGLTPELRPSYGNNLFVFGLPE